MFIMKHLWAGLFAKDLPQLESRWVEPDIHGKPIEPVDSALLSVSASLDIIIEERDELEAEIRVKIERHRQLRVVADAMQATVKTLKADSVKAVSNMQVAKAEGA